MKIVLAGIETNNKGAELMLYAILQEIERKFPKAIVYLPRYSVPQGLSYIETSLDVRNKPLETLYVFVKIARRIHLQLNFVEDMYALRGIDYYLDANGFWFTDQWNISNHYVDRYSKLIKEYHQRGTKIIYLPQAFGPAEKKNTKEIFNLIGTYASLVIAREKVSYNYLVNSGIPARKIALYPDFTSLVEGKFPVKYQHLKGGICIIPNTRMFDKGGLLFDDYINTVKRVVEIADSVKKTVFLLNHEGYDDHNLVMKCKTMLGDKVDVVSNINSLEVKALISTSYLCITSRFHGAASALNSCVPCLASSWSHKYSELFSDYFQNDCLIDFTDSEVAIDKISIFLNDTINHEVRTALSKQVPSIKEKSKQMWNAVWQA